MKYKPLRPDPPDCQVGTVYVLCFSRQLKHAKHYIGFVSADLENRLQEHHAGRGARITRAAVAQGIVLRLAAKFEGVTRRTEVFLKNQGGATRWCPVCRAEGDPRATHKTLPDLARLRHV